MKYTMTKVAIISVAILGSTVFCGCDLFSPPKKPTSKPAETAPAQEKAPVAVNANNQGPLPYDVIARVGTWTLSADEFKERLKLLKQSVPDFNDQDVQTKATVLNELIRQQLLVQEAQESDIAQQKDIKDAVEDFRRTLLVQELAQRITRGVQANDEDARKYYDENKNLFIKWKVRQIVVDDEATAKNLLVQILQGGDFAALASANSKDKTASNGGLIADPAQAPLEVQKSIVALEAGGTSAVFKAGQKYYIVHVDEKSFVPLNEVKDKLKENLTLRKQQDAILEHIDQLAQKTKVEVNNELLGVEAPKKP